ncbi:hypothetical protein GLOTRDRAFT_42330, partial [Gloeophyllum trabeum ATCC 11539]
RKLVVALDGTGNKFGIKYSNVVDLYGRIMKSDDQRTYYNSGVGTYANASRMLPWRLVQQAVDSAIDLAVARNFETMILAAYRWLTENYMPGNRIFLFGFSRGAYQVRVLAAMIKCVGLLARGNQEQIPFAYELYVSNFHPQTHHILYCSDQYRCEIFRGKFSHEVSVHFMGLWDTVSSVGITRGKGLPLVDDTGHICYVRHALALDERRVKFVPEHFYRSKASMKPSEVG